MYQTTLYNEQSYEMYQLSNADGTSWLTVCPERGGIITGFGVAGDEQLYLNKDTLFDQTKNVRGGIPVLFPISGQLESGSYEWAGETYQMPNHGLARINPWEVVETEAHADYASITLRFVSSAETKEAFPFDFEVLFTYRLSGNQLTIDQRYHNLSDREMPIYAGFHPYFKSDSKTVKLRTEATTYFDYNDEMTKPFTGSVDLEGLKEAVVLRAEEPRMSAQVNATSQIVMDTDPEFPYTVLWTVRGSDFVCVEPWMAKTHELHRGDDLQMIAPKESLDTSVSFKIVSPD